MRSDGCAREVIEVTSGMNVDDGGYGMGRERGGVVALGGLLLCCRWRRAGTAEALGPRLARLLGAWTRGGRWYAGRSPLS